MTGEFVDDLGGIKGLERLDCNFSCCGEMPFRRWRVRLKKEIVTMQVNGISPTHMAGTYVKPHDWNALISDPEVIVVDTRNDYEVEMGSFAGAINPRIKSFAELPQWVQTSDALSATATQRPSRSLQWSGCSWVRTTASRSATSR